MRDDLSETALGELWRSGARPELVTRLLRAYGPEILSYLMATLRADGDATEAFSLFTLSVWQGSAGFRGESSFRTWAYALARHAAGRVLRERGRQRRQVALSNVPEIDELAARIRTDTLGYLRTEVRDRVARLRDELEPDEQTILILRVDRGFAWPDVARVLADGAPEAEADVARRVVALRKRFERIKDKLRRRAAELG